MCAIAGLVGIFPEANTVDNMLKTMRRRGPDGQGVLMEPGCTLLHSRLAVIDPVGGSQPMTLEWAGERYCLVYNGELYNTEEVRRELLALGHRFLGHSDTEVVLHAFAQWREECLERFNGIFAMAVWQCRSRKLFLARDRIGVKPLFYAQIAEGLIFGSEIKTILADSRIQPKLKAEGAAQILLLGPGRMPGSGVFEGIRELEPGYWAEFSEGKLRIKQYWKLTDREHTENLEQTVEHIRWLVTDAIRRQMVSDVPIGCFLSGGLDSSIICAICAKEKEPLDTFSVDYIDNDLYFQAGKFQPNADNSYIDLMVKTIGSRQHRCELTPMQLLDHLIPATEARDLPGMADVDFSLNAFCAQVRQHVKVALSGECADEIFGGYPWYRDPGVRNADGFPWAQNTASRVELLHPELKARIDGFDYVYSMYKKTLDDSDILPGNAPTERRMKQMVNLNFKWFMQTLLDRKDRMSMYHGLEVRVPFCDHRIAQYMYAVPWEFKDLRGREKGLLRKAMEDLLPVEVLYRKKSPYPKTHHPMYRSLIHEALTELLEWPKAPVFSVIDREAMAKYIEHEPTWPWYGQLMAMPQTMAYFLQINHWMEHYGVEPVW